VSNSSITAIPTRLIGPVAITGPLCNDEFMVPMATFETTLWPSTLRGAKATKAAGGIYADVVTDTMTRSIVLEAKNSAAATDLINYCQQNIASISKVISRQSSYAKLEHLNFEQLSRIVYIRIAIESGNASGHNMVTKAADAVIAWIIEHKPQIKYISISANYCTDKKVSAVNGILGRGKKVICDITISKDICAQHLRTTPEKLVDLHIKKNLLGSNLAGSIRSANSHVANILLATYLALGQDAANIIEGSQSIVNAECIKGDLYFSLTMPNIIVGTVGNGKHYPSIASNLQLLKCDPNTKDSARKLAAIIGATALCGELSCLAAQCNQGELTRSHMYFEREHRNTLQGDE
jgi:hydroxymethylglutaryl-CoA reductase (NADPH)